MVQPQNIGSAVEEFLSLLHLNPHQEFVLEQNDPGIPVVILLPPSHASSFQASTPLLPSRTPFMYLFVVIFSEFFMYRLSVLQTNNFLSSSQMSSSPLPSPPPAPYTTSHLTTWTSSQSPDAHSSPSFATSRPVTWRERNWKNSPAQRDRWEDVRCN